MTFLLYNMYGSLDLPLNPLPWQRIVLFWRLTLPTLSAN
jgi:hypothetical protein